MIFIHGSLQSETTELGEIALDWSSDAVEEYTCTGHMIIGVMELEQQSTVLFQ